MVNPWVRNYLVLSVAGLELAEHASRMWQDVFSAYITPVPAMTNDPWLASVYASHAQPLKRMNVGNCAAAVYSRWGVDLSRLPVANSAAPGRRDRCS